MLLTAERIISHGDPITNKSEHEMMCILRNEMAEKIVDDMITYGIVKMEVLSEVNDDFGTLMKIRASVRAYNPDA